MNYTPEERRRIIFKEMFTEEVKLANAFITKNGFNNTADRAMFFARVYAKTFGLTNYDKVYSNIRGLKHISKSDNVADFLTTSELRKSALTLHLFNKSVAERRYSTKEMDIFATIKSCAEESSEYFKKIALSEISLLKRNINEDDFCYDPDESNIKLKANRFKTAIKKEYFPYIDNVQDMENREQLIDIYQHAFTKLVQVVEEKGYPKTFAITMIKHNNIGFYQTYAGLSGTDTHNTTFPEPYQLIKNEQNFALTAQMLSASIDKLDELIGIVNEIPSQKGICEKAQEIGEQMREGFYKQNKIYPEFTQAYVNMFVLAALPQSVKTITVEEILPF